MDSATEREKSVLSRTRTRAALLLPLLMIAQVATMSAPPLPDEVTPAAVVAGDVCHRTPVLLLQTSLLRAMHYNTNCPAVTLGDAAPVTLTEPPNGTAGVLVASASPCPGLETEGDAVCADGARKRLHFGGSPLRVLTLHFPPFVMNVSAAAPTAVSTGSNLNAGVEMQLMALLASRAGLTLEVRDGGADSWIQNLAKLRRGDVDACVGGFWADAERLPLYVMTPPYVWERLRLFVPLRSPRPGWQSIFLVFDATVWTLLLLSFGTATLLAARVSDDRDGGFTDRMTQAALDTLSLLFCLSPARAPRRPYLRAVFLMWAAFCLQMNVAFQSELVKLLVKPGTEEGVTSVTQLIGAAPPLRAAMIERVVQIMNSSEDGRYVAFAARAKVCHNLYTCLRRVERGRHLAVVSCETYARFYVGGGVRALRETFISYGVVTYLRRYAPYTRRLCELVTRSIEAGLFVKWAEDVGQNRWDDGNDDLDADVDGVDDGVPEELGVGNLQACFWLLAVGLGVASLVLVAEILLRNKFTPNNVKSR